MPSLIRSALIEHPAQAMFDLVCDVESYPQFLPWCDAARVDEQSDSHQLASVTIGKYLAQSEFVTRNELVPGEQILMQLVEGPFRHLRGTWKFTALSAEACKIELEIDFEFASNMVAKMIAPAFNSVCDTIVTAFVKRADYLAREAGSS